MNNIMFRVIIPLTIEPFEAIDELPAHQPTNCRNYINTLEGGQVEVGDE